MAKYKISKLDNDFSLSCGGNVGRVTAMDLDGNVNGCNVLLPSDMSGADSLVSINGGFIKNSGTIVFPSSLEEFSVRGVENGVTLDFSNVSTFDLSNLSVGSGEYGIKFNADMYEDYSKCQELSGLMDSGINVKGLPLVWRDENNNEVEKPQEASEDYVGNSVEVSGTSEIEYDITNVYGDYDVDSGSIDTSLYTFVTDANDLMNNADYNFNESDFGFTAECNYEVWSKFALNENIDDNIYTLDITELPTNAVELNDGNHNMYATPWNGEGIDTDMAVKSAIDDWVETFYEGDRTMELYRIPTEYLGADGWAKESFEEDGITWHLNDYGSDANAPTMEYTGCPSSWQDISDGQYLPLDEVFDGTTWKSGFWYDNYWWELGDDSTDIAKYYNGQGYGDWYVDDSETSNYNGATIEYINDSRITDLSDFASISGDNEYSEYECHWNNLVETDISGEIDYKDKNGNSYTANVEITDNLNGTGYADITSFEIRVENYESIASEIEGYNDGDWVTCYFDYANKQMYAVSDNSQNSSSIHSFETYSNNQQIDVVCQDSYEYSTPSLSDLQSLSVTDSWNTKVAVSADMDSVVWQENYEDLAEKLLEDPNHTLDFTNSMGYVQVSGSFTEQLEVMFRRGFKYYEYAEFFYTEDSGNEQSKYIDKIPTEYTRDMYVRKMCTLTYVGDKETIGGDNHTYTCGLNDNYDE